MHLFYFYSARDNASMYVCIIYVNVSCTYVSRPVLTGRRSQVKKFVSPKGIRQVNK